MRLENEMLRKLWTAYFSDLYPWRFGKSEEFREVYRALDSEAREEFDAALDAVLKNHRLHGMWSLVQRSKRERRRARFPDWAVEYVTVEGPVHWAHHMATDLLLSHYESLCKATGASSFFRESWKPLGALLILTVAISGVVLLYLYVGEPAPGSSLLTVAARAVGFLLLYPILALTGWAALYLAALLLAALVSVVTGWIIRRFDLPLSR